MTDANCAICHGAGLNYTYEVGSGGPIEESVCDCSRDWDAEFDAALAKGERLAKAVDKKLRQMESREAAADLMVIALRNQAKADEFTIESLRAELARVTRERDEARRERDVFSHDSLAAAAKLAVTERDAARAELARVTAERDELRKRDKVWQEALEGTVCQITGRRYFMTIKNRDTWVATYGGPYDSYTQARRGADGDWIARPGVGPELHDTDEERADYWAYACEIERKTARDALAALDGKGGDDAAR